MPCNATSQLTNAPSVPLQVTMPTNNAQWAVFVQRLQDAINATRDAANRTGVNVVPAAYAVYDAAALPALSINGASAVLDGTQSQFGKASLKLTATATTVTVSFTGNPIAITAYQRWIESVYIQSSRASIGGTLAVVTPAASYPVDISGTLLPATWGRLYGDCSLVADASTQATMTLTLTGCSVGDTFNLEGWQLEQAAGNTNLPSAFVNSAAPGSQDTLPDGSGFVRLSSSHASGNVAYNYRGVWSSATAYVTGDEIVYSGSYWLCLTGNTNSAPAQGNGNWQVVGAYNNYQGAWSSTVTYYAGQETTYSGNYWVATATNTNSAPSTSDANWVIAGPQNLDHVADGTGRFAVVNGGGLNAVSAVDPNKRALVDFTQSGHTGKSLANVPDDPTTTRYAVSNIDGNRRALIDATQAGHVGAWSLDSRVADGVNFQRVGSGYADSSGRIVTLWDGVARRSAANTWDGANRARTGLDSSGVLVANLHPVDNLKDGVYFRGIHSPAIQAGIYQPGANLVYNPLFALGNAGYQAQPWTVYSAAQGGPYAVTNLTATPTTSVIVTNRFTCAAGQALSAALEYGIQTTLTAGDLSADIQWYTSTGAPNGNSARIMVATAASTFIQGTLANIVAPAGTAYAAMRVFIEGATGTNNVLVRRLKVEYGTTCTPFNDDTTQAGNLLTVSGSGQQIGDQRNAPSSLTRNLGLVRSSTALTVFSTGAVNVNAHSIQLGAANIPYNAVTNAVTGLSVGSSYYIYTNDNYAGGTQAWSATTSASTANNNDTAYNAGQVTVPSSGSGGAGAAGGCVGADMWLRRGLTARDLAKRWRWWRPYILRGQEGWHFVRKRPVIVQEPCVRLTVADGSYLDCSTSTPVIVRDGARLRAPDVYGREMFTDHGWQRVIECELLPGLRDVVRINLGQHTMLAGADPRRRLDTHNWKP